MLAQLFNTSDWTHEQWLAACILAFIVVTVIVVLFRIAALVRLTRKKDYRPNLRPLRRGRQR